MKKKQGFTMIELMMVIAVFSVLAMVAIPSFDRSFKKAAISKLSDQIESSLRLARIAAMSNGENVIVCPIEDVNNIFVSSGVLCLDKWSKLNSEKSGKGWVVFTTLSTEPPFVNLTEEENLIQVVDFDGGSGRAFFDDALTNLNRPSFSRRGYGKSGTIAITTPANSDIGRRIVVSNSGRVKNVPKQ